jgi:DNA-binding HxlR family transcriptional regulator
MENQIPDVYNPLCPSRQVLSRVGDKWVVLIIGILQQGTIRFGVLKREAAGISQKMLTQTLRNLERDGLVDRRVFAEVPVRVEYSLTELGSSLLPVLIPLMRWSEAHLKEIEAAQKQFDAAQDDSSTP